MKNILAIAGTESRRIFVSPLAWTVLGVVQLILGIVFVLTLLDFARMSGMSNGGYGVSDYVGGSVFGFAVIVLLLVIPLMTMRLFAEERKSGSLTLLFSAPVSLTQIVLGKFLGLMTFIIAVLALLALMPFSLIPATHLDIGRILAGLFGLLMMMMAFGSAGMFVSSLTREPTIAAVGSFGLLLVIWLINMLSYNDSIPFGALFGYLSLIGHFESMRRGIFDSADAIYYVLFTTLFLWLTVQRLDMERN
ncbi:MAG TPA: ABC transporter permease [Stenotrophobium sp.]|jgi:ABC-2 type transport system permease protein|nr:ABC transporter permease [Stenotrophobium sp.]